MPVSIHALLAECDMGVLFLLMFHDGFNPRTPCGVRHTGREPGPLSEKFQSTHSLRSATGAAFRRRYSEAFVSIHALLAECDHGFNDDINWYDLVSIHALLAECDVIAHPVKPAHMVSIHALLAECD